MRTETLCLEFFKQVEKEERGESNAPSWKNGGAIWANDPSGTHLYGEQVCPRSRRASVPTMYAGVCFFDKHTLRPEYNPGHVRLALDIVKALRPHELFPRAFKALN